MRIPAEGTVGSRAAFDLPPHRHSPPLGGGRDHAAPGRRSRPKHTTRTPFLVGGGAEQMRRRATYTVACLAGDGVGPELMAEACRTLAEVSRLHGFRVEDVH